MVAGTVTVPLVEQLHVMVSTATGKPAAGVAVAFAPAEGSGTVGATPVRTDASGVASATWTLGTKAGRQTMVASVSGLTPVTFVATAGSSTATRLVKVAGDSQTTVVAAGPAMPLTVRAIDAFGNAVAGASVDVAVKSGGGTLAATRATSDQDGIASISGWSMGTRVGTNEIEVKLGTAEPIRFMASAIAGVPDTVAFTSSDTLWLVATDSAALRVRASDRYGNVASTAGATFTADDDRIARTNGGYLLGRGAGVTSVRVRLGNASASRMAAVRGHPSATATVVHSVRWGAGFGASIIGDRILSTVGAKRVMIYDTAGTALGAPIDLPFTYGGVIGITPLGPRTAFITSEFDDFAAILDLGTRRATMAPGYWYFATRPRRSFDGNSTYQLNYWTVSRFDLTTGKIVDGPYRNSITTVDYAQSNSLLVSAGSDGHIDVIDPLTMQRKWAIWLTEPPKRIAVARSGEYLYASNAKIGSIDVYKLTDGQNRLASVSANSDPRLLATSPDGLELYVINDLGELRVFSLADPTRPTLVRSLPLGAAFVEAEISFDDLGSTMLINGTSGSFLIMR